MGIFYTAADVLRWEEIATKDIPFQMEALRQPNLTSNIRWQRYGSLKGDYHSLAMVSIARKKFDDARQNLRKATEMTLEQYAIRSADRGETSAGDFQAVLLAYVTAYQAVISKMVTVYSWAKGVPESVFLGKIIKFLALMDIPNAQDVLVQKRPRLEKMFDGYPDCLQAIANKDEAALQAAITVASKSWARRAARFEKGLPHSVCFLQGVGLIRLAQQVMNVKLSISDENLPPELLSA